MSPAGRAPALVYLGLGSNLGDRAANLGRARALLAALPGTTLTGQSSVYVTAPVGGPEQDDYLNQVVELRTVLSPRELLAAVQGVESELGRRRTVRWGPRSIDVDILWYHGFSSADAELQVPHPRMEERRFVLEPLAELAPDLELRPGRSVAEALESVRDQLVTRASVEVGATTLRTSKGPSMDYAAIHAEIRRLAAEKQAVILVHNYQRPEVQDVADLTGDSLGLSREAAASTARMIVFCGVHFMAETAAILAPDRPVIAPEVQAGCPMADMVDEQGLQALRAEHPDAVVVSYVNTTAAVKALSDICCTSANAAEVLRSVPAGTEIIFTPDRNLGAWAARKAGRDVILWPGFCPTHDLIEVADVERARAAHPQAKVVVHPECRLEVAEMADAVESTSGMIRYCREDDASEYLIGTEIGMLYRLSQDIPHKCFYPVTEMAVCPHMKLTTLDKVLKALRTGAPVVTVDPETRKKALRAVQRMIEVGAR
ncbi:MAG: quinolinate synthase NadA [Thermoleophilia bacterium]|nr:quinolinate synthase NadA [Thermoleophilia bacterium]